MPEVVIHAAENGRFGLSELAVKRIVELLCKSDENCGLDESSLGHATFMIECELPRHNRALVEAVKELGALAHKDAEGRYPPPNPFQIVVVEDEYYIDDYDGTESVVEPRHIKWRRASDTSLESVNVADFFKRETSQHESRKRRQEEKSAAVREDIDQWIMELEGEKREKRRRIGWEEEENLKNV